MLIFTQFLYNKTQYNIYCMGRKNHTIYAPMVHEHYVSAYHVEILCAT